MVRYILKMVLYLMCSIMIGIAVTLVLDRIDNIAVEKQLRESLKGEILGAAAAFEGTADNHEISDITGFIKRFASTVMKDKVQAVDNNMNETANTQKNKFFFHIPMEGQNIDIYVRRVFLDTELAALETSELVAGIITTIIVFTAIVGYTENRRRLKEMRTHYEHTHRELSQALKKNEALALLGQMTATLAHELQTPIATLSNLIQSLPTRQADMQFVDRFTALATDELHRTQRLIDNLLIYGKDITVKNDEWIEFKPFIAKLAVKSMVRVFSCPEFSLLFDKFYAGLMFNNLLMNSKQAGATEITIRTVADEHGSFVNIFVEDNGGGFPQLAALQELTSPFVTGRAKGAGLGLFLVEKIIKAYEGDISLYSHVKGAGVKLVLPKTRLKFVG
ncbi:MAG: HAMP domain-containing histidine kinase [Nitrospirae bacterium]|nr:HAMP domain-containing histidine kinase [Nitrospirota bacterium]